MKRELTNRFLGVLDEYRSLGIAEQIDYQKFYLYSIITHSTAIEGSTVTEMSVSAGIGGQSYMNFLKVPTKTQEFCQQLNESRRNFFSTEDVIGKYILSFDAHYQLVTIHPWVDGNGRMSRLVMNMLQYEFGLVPVKIIKEDKAEYIKALMDSRKQDSPEPFRTFMIEEHIQNLSNEIVEYKQSQSADPIKSPLDPIKPFSDPITERLFQAIRQDGDLNYSEYAEKLGVSEATVKRRIGELKKTGAIVRVGSNKTGHWEIDAGR